MRSDAALSDALSKPEVSNRDKLLLILSGSDAALSVAEIRRTAAQSGLREAQRWNVSQLLGNAKGLAIRLEEGWTLTTQGHEHVLNSKLLPAKNIPKTVIVDLRKHLAGINNRDTRSFLEEAILCFEYELYRSAVVLSWVGAMSLLYDHVVTHKLDDFNREAKRRDEKWRAAKTSDDLVRMKEHDFLNVLETMSVIGKNAKQELQNNCLKLRNACGHPNSLAISQNRVAAHLELLVLNVFSRFE